MAQEHFYKNHEEVIRILTDQYGFTYDGIGDNAEECFQKDSEAPETVFIHPMFCSHYMAASRGIMAPRLHEFHVSSDHKSEENQRLVFHKLLVHLDEVTIKEKVVV